MSKKKLVALCIFFLSIILISQNLNKPFWGEHDWNGARYGNIARNYLRYGLIDTKLGQVENSGYVETGEFDYFTHYPPLFPLLVSFSYTLFGISEISTRFVPVFATSAILVLIFLVGTEIENIRRGLIASFYALATPLVLYFGKNPVHESVVVFFSLLSLWSFLNYLKNDKKVFKFISIISMIFAQLTTWVGFFLIPAITLVLYIKNDKKIRKVIPFWIISFVVFVAYFVHIAILTGLITGGGMQDVLLQRTGLTKAVQPEGFNLFSYLIKIRLWISTLFTISLSLLVVIWVVISRLGLTSKEWPVLSLAIFGLIYALIFPNALFIHSYLIFYFLPFFCLAASGATTYLMKRMFLRQVKFILPLIFVVLIFFERKDFLDALQSSGADKLAVEIGKALNKLTTPYEKVLVSPTEYSYSASNFLKFYSDRKLIFSRNDGDFDIKVVVDETKGTYIIRR